MNCPKCGKYIDGNMLTCIACALKGNDETIRQFQVEPLLTVQAGRGALQGYRCSDHVLHARMFRSDICFCGRPAAAPPNRRTPIFWNSLAMGAMCRKCRAAIDAILAEAKAPA